MTEDDVERVLLTAENIKDADEFMDGEGSTCRRMPNGHWSWVDDHDAAATDARIMERPWRYMRGAYVTRWKPGREPKAPPPASKWVKGYVTQENDFAPDRVMLCSSTGNVFESGGVFVGPGLVVVREAPQPPKEEPWRRCIVEVRGNGANARVRFTSGHMGLKGLLSAGIFAAYAAPAPDRVKAGDMLQGVLDAYYLNHGDTKDRINDFLDYVCGPAPKDGDA